jgi:hypothetical protein
MSRARERTDGASSKAKKLIAIEVNGETLTIDIKAMTLRERQAMRAQLAKLEVEPDWMDQIAAQVWVAMRRRDEDVTFGDVLDALDVADVEALEWIEAEADSPEA